MISLKCQRIIVQQKTVGFTLRAADGGPQGRSVLHCVDGMAGRACALIRLQIVCIMHIYTCTTKLVGLYRAVQCTVHVLICKDIHEICTQCLPTPRNIRKPSV